VTDAPQTVHIDFDKIFTAVLDALVEAIADQIAYPGDEIAVQALLYESIASACTKKAELARAFDRGAQTPEGG
jgi:hypothetical protein